MTKMRVFELARDLNIPSKDLIKRINAMGFKVDGNFNVLEEDTVAQIKAKMLEPVTRVETQAVASEGEGGETPRKRRIISARKSGEVHKIQESLGVSGPLPEDIQSRAEVKPEPPLPTGEAPAEAKPRLVRTPRAGEAAGAPSAPEAPEAAQAPPLAAQAPATPGPTAAAPAASQPAVPTPVGVMMPVRQPAGLKILKKGTPPTPAEEAAAAGWKEVKKGDRKRGAYIEEDTPARWRDARRMDTRRGADTLGGEEAGRAPRRRSPEKRARLAARGLQQQEEQKHIFGPRKRAIRIGQAITVSELASAIGVKAGEIIKKLMDLGVMATINAPIDGTTAQLVAADFNVEITADTSDLEDIVREETVDESRLARRPPIVTIMGHVDHGKTTLLDYIRKTHVTEKEAGGITQHIGAYYVRAEAGDIVFLDTPGHEAFTSLRRRGADITDIVVLIVAADDGVMPQTVEAIEHARAAKVPIMVAINKMDRPGADPGKIKRQLMEHGLVPEEFGGETVVVPISAKTGEGVAQLMELIHLQAEVLDVKALPEGPARGYVIESKMDRQRGPVATVIVQRGALKVGDYFVAGETFGRVRAMFDDLGQPLDTALPSRPAEILGSNDVPTAGDAFVVVADEQSARDLAQQRATRRKERAVAESRHTQLETFLQQAAGSEEKRILKLVVKADTQGSLEAIRASLLREGNEQVGVEILRAGVGGITETDVGLAATSDAVVIGFAVRPEAKAAELARSEGVDIKLYTIIYQLIDDVHASLQGLLRPVVREEVIGHCEVRQVFHLSREGQIAGAYVTDGRVERNSQVRVFRDNVLVHTGPIGTLRRFKDDVSQVQSGFECGLRIANFNDVKQGDLIEAFVRVEEAPKLERAGQRA
jgi:translation initiation factor IF-2